MNKLRIMILGFGGTIAMVPDNSGVLKPAKSVEEIIAIVPSLREVAEVSFQEIENRDSTNINPGHWTKLAFVIDKIQKEYDGIIVTHGTDTMTYTAGAISLVFGHDLRVPVVFTGSQLPLVAYGSDAQFNLEWAMKTIGTACEQKIREVMIVFSDLVLRASRAVKTSESHFRAFDSPAFPALARITATGVGFIPEAFRAELKQISVLPQGVGRSSVNQQTAVIKPHFQRGIMSLEIVPGLEPGIIMEALRSGKCQGLLLKSLGAGNVPSEDEYSLLPVIEEAINTFKIPVLVSTKFVGGRTHMDIYEPGRLALRAGAIPTGDLTDVMAQVKLMWALAQGHRSNDELTEVINTDIAGEITV